MRMRRCSGEMLSAKNADRAGEFSPTDFRGCRKRPPTFLATGPVRREHRRPVHATICHLAVERTAIKNNVRRLIAELRCQSAERAIGRASMTWSPSMADIVSTTDRVVTATLSDGSERVIYRTGQFVDDALQARLISSIGSNRAG